MFWKTFLIGTSFHYNLRIKLLSMNMHFYEFKKELKKLLLNISLYSVNYFWKAAEVIGTSFTGSLYVSVKDYSIFILGTFSIDEWMSWLNDDKYVCLHVKIVNECQRFQLILQHKCKFVTMQYNIFVFNDLIYYDCDITFYYFQKQNINFLSTLRTTTNPQQLNKCN